MDGLAVPEVNWLVWTSIAIGAVVLLMIWTLVRKGRRLPGEHVFRGSRLSKGNRIFPAQVAITPSSITLYHPQWIGKLEKSIHMAHVASIKIDTNVLFADVLIETTGGQNPILCEGHTKGDAVKMKAVIEKFQSAYYRTNQT